ncbi:MAG: TonB-dependent receptor [Cytophagales bacterium]|nr:TonB-dependent receptor [Cytophagales bacterium]
MKKALLIFTLLASSFGLYAQTGTISGTITDKETGEELIGATVYIPSIGKGAATDIYGKFFIKGLEAGTYTVQANSISYKQQLVQEVLVKKGENTALDVMLIPDLSELDAVVVTSTQISNNQASLIALQKKALAVQDGISVDEIKKLGVSNAAESMKYVTGASVDGGKYMVMRGLGDRYSLTQMNGIMLPSTDPYRNSTSLDLIPADMIDNLVTVKTFTPDQPGSFTGGKVDITTKSLPEEFYLSLGAKATYNTQSSFIDNFLADGAKGDFDWLGYDDGTRKKPGALSKYRKYILGANAGNSADDAADRRYVNERKAINKTAKAFDNPLTAARKNAPMNTGFDLAVGNRYELFGRPLGVNVGAVYSRSFSFFENGKIGLYNLVNSREGKPSMDAEKDYLWTRGIEAVQLGALATVAYQLSPNHEITLMNLYSHDYESKAEIKNGAWASIGGNLNYESQTIHVVIREFNNSQISGKHYFEKWNGLKVDWAAGYVSSSQNEPDARFNGYLVDDAGESPKYMYSPSEIGFNPTHLYRSLKDKQINAKLDVTVPLGNDSENILKAGGAFSSKGRRFEESIYRINFAGGGSGIPNYKKLNAEGVTMDDYLASGNAGVLGQYTDFQGKKVYGIGNYYSDETVLGNSYSGKENVYAAYAMAAVKPFPKLKIIGGLRYEVTDMYADSDSQSNKRGEVDVSDYLPALSGVYKLNDKSNIRFAYSATIARPNMREISPFTSFGAPDDDVRTGNDSLRRTKIHNLDLRYELFQNPGELFALSAYYKVFKDPIVWKLEPLGSVAQLAPVNTENALVLGFEVEFRKKVLESAGSDLLLAVNGSLIYSRVDKDRTEVDTFKKLGRDFKEWRPFMGQAPYIANFSVAHKLKVLDWENSLAFNVSGKRLVYFSTPSNPDIYLQPKPSLNWVSTKSFGDHWVAKLKINNILNSEHKESYDGYEDSVYINYKSGVSFSLGLAYKL